MIVVKNTKELEENYDINGIPDNETVIIQGGFKGKEKYNHEEYKKRMTYTGIQVKQILGQMHLIEDSIPEQWDDFQKAKYIYEVLGKKIDYDYEIKYPRNLTALINGSTVCAGYALLYKEMMDRQGIECDYVRGRITIDQEDKKSFRHAWNVLTINGKSFSVDLTNDSEELRNGEELKYFGASKYFYDISTIDPDEKQYNYVLLEKENVKAINTDPKLQPKRNLNNQPQVVQSTNSDREDVSPQKIAVQLAIEQTYLNFKPEYGEENARLQVKLAIQQYISDGNARGFTRKNNARDQLKEKVTPEDMLDIMAQSYVESDMETTSDDVLRNSINENIKAYGTENAKVALLSYIKTGKINRFTRTNQARKNIELYQTPQSSEELMISSVVDDTINSLEKSRNVGAQEKYFSADEFAVLELPKEKGILTKSINWIKNKTIERRNMKKIQEQESQRNENDIQNYQDREE